MTLRLFLLLIIECFINSTFSQSAIKQWSLEECILYALSNNITIQQQELQTQYNANILTQRKLSRYPNLRSNIEVRKQMGLAGAEKDIESGNLNVYSTTPLFNGFSKQSEVKEQKAILDASILDLAKSQNDISLLIVNDFMQVIFNKELLEITKQQADVTQLQFEKTKKMVETGSLALGNLLEIKAQLASENVKIAQQQNNLSLSILSLAQLLNIENPDSFDIQKPEIPELQKSDISSPNDIYASALGLMPEIKGAERRLDGSAYNVKSSKGQLYPSVNLNLGYSTMMNNFSNQMATQFTDNAYSYVGLSVDIPIFNGYQSRTVVKNAQINLLSAKYNLLNEKQTLRKEIQQAYANAIASYNTYLASQEAQVSLKEAFMYAQKRFDLGMATAVDFNLAKTNLAKAEADLSQAKYEFLLRLKIIDFYKGLPLKM